MEDAKKVKRAPAPGGERSSEGDTAHDKKLAEGRDEITSGGSGVESPGASTHRPAKKTKRSVTDADAIPPVDGNSRDPDDADQAEVRVMCEPFAGVFDSWDDMEAAFSGYLPARYIPSLQTADEQLN
ncbi:hypothetical protein PInf_001604 [Phytophthora infestans]|nr:hypothetical protein PInf_001604 [Phytophthora infestans]